MKERARSLAIRAARSSSTAKSGAMPKRDEPERATRAAKESKVEIWACEKSARQEARCPASSGVVGAGGRGRQRAVDAGVHLGRGLAREGEDQDIARVDALARGQDARHAARGQKPDVARGEDGGLARTGPRRHDEVPGQGRGLSLRALEVLGELVRAFGTHRPPPKRRA